MSCAAVLQLGGSRSRALSPPEIKKKVLTPFSRLVDFRCVKQAAAGGYEAGTTTFAAATASSCCFSDSA